MAGGTWEHAVSDVLSRVAADCADAVTGYRLAAEACELGEYMVRKVESSQGLEGAADCEKGCSWCCHAQVPVSRPEAELITAWMAENLSEEELVEVRRRVAHNLELTHGRSLVERVSVWDRTPCIFLRESVCRVYPARPLVCRAWHAVDHVQCRKAFEARESGAEIDNTPYRNHILGVVRDELARLKPWPRDGVLPLPEAMAALFS